jgi:hypothetical protein
MPVRLAWLFSAYLSELYARRQWGEIEKFEATSAGARLVGALVLATGRPGEFVTSAEAQQLDKFHDDRGKWLSGYVFGSSCNAECKGKLIDWIISNMAEAGGRFDGMMRTLFTRPRAEVGPALARLHARLLTCAVEADDLAALRDRVLVPALGDELGRDKPETGAIDDLAGLLALAPPPADKDALARWKAVVDKLSHALKDRYAAVFVNRRSYARTVRTAPPPSLKKSMFCNARQAADEEVDLDE